MSWLPFCSWYCQMVTWLSRCSRSLKLQELPFFSRLDKNLKWWHLCTILVCQTMADTLFLDLFLFCHLHAHPLPANYLSLYMWILLVLLVCVWSSSRFLMTIYGPCCRQPADYLAEMHTNSNTVLSLSPSSVCSSLHLSLWYWVSPSFCLFSAVDFSVLSFLHWVWYLFLLPGLSLAFSVFSRSLPLWHTLCLSLSHTYTHTHTHTEA